MSNIYFKNNLKIILSEKKDKWKEIKDAHDPVHTLLYTQAPSTQSK